MSLLKELQRRNVFKVVAGYLVLGWLILQIADVVVPALKLPEWTISFLLIVGLLGLPLVLFLAWAFEITPEGIKRESEVKREHSIADQTGRKIDRIVIGLMAVALGYFIWESRFQESSQSEPETVQSTTQQIVDKSVAVLPFLNMSSDEEQGWFADGLTEEILNALVRARDLKVSSRTSSFTYKGTEKDLRTIGQELGVQHILEGSIRRSGDQIRVTAQLIRVNDDFHLWSQTYDRDYKDIISIQEDVAVSIANALQTAMDPESLNAMTQVGTRSIEAYELYLKATARLFEQGFATEAIELLEKALKEDPNFSRAKAALGRAWLETLNIAIIGYETTYTDPDEQKRKAFNFLQEAINELQDPAEITYLKGIVAKAQLRLNDARKLFEQVLEINASHTEATYELISILSYIDDYDALSKTLAIAEQNLAHDARFHLSNIQNNYWAKQSEKAARAADKAQEQLPTTALVAYQAVRAYLGNNEVENAIKANATVQSSDLDPAIKGLAALRLACYQKDLITAQQIFNANYGREDAILVVKWIYLNLMGRYDEAVALLKPFDEQRRFSELTSVLIYYYFDINEYPNFKAALERNDVHRKPYRPHDLACPAS